MRARADERGQLTGGASSAAREKGETARAAGVGALSRPTRRVVGRCGRSAAGPPAGRAEQAGRREREGMLGRPFPWLG